MCVTAASVGIVQVVAWWVPVLAVTGLAAYLVGLRRVELERRARVTRAATRARRERAEAETARRRAGEEQATAGSGTDAPAGSAPAPRADLETGSRRAEEQVSRKHAERRSDNDGGCLVWSPDSLTLLPVRQRYSSVLPVFFRDASGLKSSGCKVLGVLWLRDVPGRAEGAVEVPLWRARGGTGGDDVGEQGNVVRLEGFGQQGRLVPFVEQVVDRLQVIEQLLRGLCRFVAVHGRALQIRGRRWSCRG